MASNYVIWSAFADPTRNFCVLDELENVRKSYQLNEGISRLQGFPDTAQFQMDPEYPKAVVLPDNVRNVDSVAVVSNNLKEFIESWQPRDVEYLPVKIIDHKGKVASEKHFVVNPINLQDCLDTNKSGCKWSDIVRDKIYELEKLIIDESRIAAETLVFRMKYYYRPILVRRDLADAISQQGFTGVLWTELDKFSS
jgi:hypothetical protein